MDRDDPLSKFFPGEDNIDLYGVLRLESNATMNDIKKAYRKLALLYHPDKHMKSSDDERAAASVQFQKIGFAYAVLGDKKRRKKFDQYGTTDEGLGPDGDEDGGWEAYFEDLFDRVTRGKLDEMKKEYQGMSTRWLISHSDAFLSGSAEEVQDLKAAYLETEGSLDEILKTIPHSTIDDEPRFIRIISDLIQQGELSNLPLWKSSSKDENSKRARKKQGEQEAKEAEELAKDLGVWDEFYGDGKVGARRGKSNTRPNREEDGDEGNSTLQALIVRRQKARNGFLDNLEAKYVAIEESSSRKGVKKRKVPTSNKSAEDGPSPKKKSRSEPDGPPKRSTRIKRAKK